MAAAEVFANDDLLCPICRELFVDPNIPKNLPCGHVSCEVCLKQMVAGKHQRNCPECRKIIRIPAGESVSFTSFSTNFRLRSLAENYQRKGKVPICLDHDDEKMHYYCVTCKSLACQACLLLKHNGTGHNIKGVKEICKNQKASLKSASTKAKSRIDEDNSVLRKLKAIEIKSTEYYQNMQEQIDKCAQSRIDKILKESGKLKSQVEQAEQMQNLVLRNVLATVEKRVHSAETAHQAALNATAKLSDYEYITKHSQLVNAMEKIQKLKPIEVDPNKTQKHAIRFVLNPSRQKFGRIISVQTLIHTQTLDGYIEANRLDCTTAGLVAVAEYDGKMVFIYHKVGGKYRKKLDLKLTPGNQYKPDDVAITPDGRFMVARVKCIEVYSPEGIHQNDIEINGSSKVHAHRVKVTSDDRILVGDYYASLIAEISPTGDVIRTIHSSIKPTQMTLIRDTHIAVSNLEAGKVIVIDVESGRETVQIDIPAVQGICYDERTDCLLAASSQPTGGCGTVRLNTGVIEQYSYTTGKLIACLQQGLYAPLGMALTPERHLILANKKSVEIYGIYDLFQENINLGAQIKNETRSFEILHS